MKTFKEYMNIEPSLSAGGLELTKQLEAIFKKYDQSINPSGYSFEALSDEDILDYSRELKATFNNFSKNDQKVYINQLQKQVGLGKKDYESYMASMILLDIYQLVPDVDTPIGHAWTAGIKKVLKGTNR